MLFSPGIYEHAAALIGYTPYEVSRKGAYLAKAHQTAWDKYQHPLVVAGIDVYNLEPEAYGAVIPKPTSNNIPAISRHPCEEIDDIIELPELEPLKHPRIREVLAAGKMLKKSCPGAEVRVPVCGPFALGIGLLGMDELLMGIIEDPEALMDALTHLLKGQANYLQAIHAAGLQPIFFESGTCPPLLSVQHFTDVEAPLLKKIFAESKKIFGEAPPCIIGGDATQIAKPFLEAGPGWVIAPSETDQCAFMEVAEEFRDTHVRVNMEATCLLKKDMSPIIEEANRAVALANSRPNTSVGCGVVPFETDPDTITAIRDYIER